MVQEHFDFFRAAGGHCDNVIPAVMVDVSHGHLHAAIDGAAISVDAELRQFARPWDGSDRR